MNTIEHQSFRRLPPCALDAEQSVLGGLMLDKQVWDTVSSELCEDDFDRHEHRVLFRVKDKLSSAEQPFDMITISDTLKSMNELDNVGGDVFLLELSNNTPSALTYLRCPSIMANGFRTFGTALVKELLKLASFFSASGVDSVVYSVSSNVFFARDNE